jgi:hypothetical protein
MKAYGILKDKKFNKLSGRRDADFRFDCTEVEESKNSICFIVVALVPTGTLDSHGNESDDDLPDSFDHMIPPNTGPPA